MPAVRRDPSVTSLDQHHHAVLSPERSRALSSRARILAAASVTYNAADRLPVTLADPELAESEPSGYESAATGD